MWNPATSADGWFASPDNCTIDALGRLWVATDQGAAWAKTGKADGLYAVSTEGGERGPVQAVLPRARSGPSCAARASRPTPRRCSWPCSIRRRTGCSNWKPFGRESTFEDPATRWPDFKPDMPPRPSIVAIRKQGGGKIASS